MNTIRVAGVKNPVAISHIMYVIGNGNYSEVYTRDGKHVLASMTLKAIEEQSDELIRIHRGSLVNPEFIKQESVRKYTLAPITMQDGKQLNVSRRRWKELFSIRGTSGYLY